MDHKVQDDDVFDESDEGMKKMEDRSYALYLEKFKTEGIREGLTSGENDVFLQEAFDAGYEVGFKSYRLKSFIKSFVSVIYGIYQEGTLSFQSEEDKETMSMFHREGKRIYEIATEDELRKFASQYSKFLVSIDCPFPSPNLDIFS